MSKATEGWSYGWDGISGGWFVPELGFQHIDSPHGPAFTDEDVARLISRAPALRDALRELLEAMRQTGGNSASSAAWERLGKAEDAADAALDGL